MSFKELRTLIPGQVWMLSAPFRMFGFLNIHNNGLIVRRKKTNGEATLVAVNAPELSQALHSDLQALEAEQGAKIDYIIETDFHHMFSKQWASKFNNALFVFPSQRAPRKYASDLKTHVLDKESPKMPDIDPDQLTLVPFLGFKSPNKEEPGEERRHECSVYLPDLKVLFIFDILISLPHWRSFLGMTPGDPDARVPMSNFGKRAAGFIIDDPAQCARSAQALLDLDTHFLVLAHGHLDCGAVREGKDKVLHAMSGLPSLLSKQA